jgi:hypothetical protein
VEGSSCSAGSASASAFGFGFADELEVKVEEAAEEAEQLASAPLHVSLIKQLP